MTDEPSPIARVDCTVVELEPAIIDAAGVVLRPAVLQMPTVGLVDLTADELAQHHADVAARDVAAAAQDSDSAAAALADLRQIRDRWLSQTDYVEAFAAGSSELSHLPQPIREAITANAAGWVSWRQALRDLPAAQGLDPVAAVAAIAEARSTADVFPAPWPQPPAAPVIYLT